MCAHRKSDQNCFKITSWICRCPFICFVWLSPLAVHNDRIYALMFYHTTCYLSSHSDLENEHQFCLVSHKYNMHLLSEFKLREYFSLNPDNPSTSLVTHQATHVWKMSFGFVLYVINTTPFAFRVILKYAST